MKFTKITNLKTYLVKTGKGYPFPVYKTTGESNFIAGLLAGVKNAGKTNTMINMLEQEPHLLEGENKVYWFSNTQDDKVKLMLDKYPNFIYVGPLDNEPFFNLIDEIKSQTEEWKEKHKLVEVLQKHLNGEKISIEDMEIINNAPANFDFEEMNLDYPPINTIVIDDSMGSPLISGYNKDAKQFSRFFIAHRHYFTNVFIMSQHIKAISKPLRVNLNLIIIFPMRSIDIYSSIFGEFANLFKNDLKNFIDLMKVIEDRQNHSFLTIYQDKQKFVRVNFDEEVAF